MQSNVTEPGATGRPHAGSASRSRCLDPSAHHGRCWPVPESVAFGIWNMRTRAVLTKQSGRSSQWPTTIVSLLLIVLLPSCAATSLPADGRADECCNIGSDSALRSYAPNDRRRVHDVDAASDEVAWRRRARPAAFGKPHQIGRAGVAKTRRAVRQHVRRHKKLPPAHPASAARLAPAPPPLMTKWQIATTPISPVAAPSPPPAPSPHSDFDALLTPPSPSIGNFGLKR
jgi:hypothetical protein